jgi:site-specific DNA recombinase
MLTGILFDETGDRLTPTHSSKRGVRYRYYVSKRIIDRGPEADDPYAGWRIRAGHLDTIVENQILQILRDGNQLTEWFGGAVAGEHVARLATQALARSTEWPDKTAEQKRFDIRSLFAKVIVRSGWIRFELDRNALFSWLMGDPLDQSIDATPPIIAIEQSMSLRRRGVENRMVLSNGASMPQPDASLIDFIVRANRYFADVTDGSPKSLSQVAREVSTNVSEVSRLLPFAFLAPGIVESILAGNQPPELGALRLGRLADLPLDWERQSELLGF